jgi:hypothetical protein
MHPTAFVVLANDRIADVAADTARIRLASQAHRVAIATTSRSDDTITTGLRAIARRLLGVVRPLPRPTAG